MIYFTSDLHFRHDREFIWKERGFSSLEEMEDTIVERWNAVVSDEDTVYVLGDLALGGNDGMEGALKLISSLKGEIRIIAGNHDTDRRIAEYKKLENVKSVSFADRIRYGGRTFFLSHYPTETSNLEADPLACVINLHGHTHSKDRFLNDKPYLYNVGLDSHGVCPVSIDEVISDFRNKVDECIGKL